jgi:hypothetical protein
MMKTLISSVAAASLLALATGAHAAQPVALSDSQMDGVTAGGVGIANAVSLTLGDAGSDTFSQTSTNVVNTGPLGGWIAIGQAFSTGAAESLLFQAASVSHADSEASLP